MLDGIVIESLCSEKQFKVCLVLSRSSLGDSERDGAKEGKVT
jgi:hypothetical protein